MSDPLRTDPSRARAARSESDRTAKIEQLLLDGLDHYFGGHYEQAINVWTRALFIDRTHARARAYIERARAALAERQRQSEELLHSGVAAFDRGESREARRLLEDAINRGAPADEALALLGRLDRMETRGPGRPSPPIRNAQGPLADQPSTPSQGHQSRAWLVTFAAAAALAAAAWLLAVAGMESSWPFSESPAELPPAPLSITAPPRVPLRGELALERARALAAGGKLHDALAAIERVRLTDAERPEADRLKAELQRRLIEFAPAAPPPTEEARQP